MTKLNRLRIHRAELAIWHYSDERERGGSVDMTDTELLTDLLADLQHYAAKHNLDFGACLSMAEQHFAAEQAEPVEAR